MYVCIYTYTYTHIYIYIYIYTYTYICITIVMITICITIMSGNGCNHSRHVELPHLFVYGSSRIYIYIYIYIHFIHTFVHIYIYIYIYGDHHKLPNRSPHLKNACVRQVALDKWFPLKSLASSFRTSSRTPQILLRGTKGVPRKGV